MTIPMSIFLLETRNCSTPLSATNPNPSVSTTPALCENLEEIRLNRSPWSVSSEKEEELCKKPLNLQVFYTKNDLQDKSIKQLDASAEIWFLY